MHELALVRSIYSIIEEKVLEYGANKVVRVRLVAGMLTGVEETIMKACFEAYVQETPAEGAALIIERVPARVQCRVCGKGYETGIPFSSCPVCGNNGIRIITGKEFYIDSMEVE